MNSSVFHSRLPFRREISWPGTATVLLLAAAISGCSKLEEFRERYAPSNPRDAYVHGLETAGLAGTLMGASWIRAGADALADPLLPGVPYHETGFVNPAEPRAVAFEIPLIRGQRLVASASFSPPDTGRIFLDLFRRRDERGVEMIAVATSDSSQTLSFDATSSGNYVLRFQPELLAGGRYELTFQTRASVVFPVSGRDSGAIHSVFGDARDGGSRSHHGVDIFAPRGTPVVSATDGIVSSTRIGGLGGKTVWVRSSQLRGNLYYAHLDEQLVERGQRVIAGDTLGLVGNTGNARTTPPHLHFGIYRNGPVDPFPFVHEPNREPEPVLADAVRAGSWMRTSVGPSILRPGPDTRSRQIHQLDRHTSIQIVAVASRYYRIRLPDGRNGFIGAAQVESEDDPIEQRVLASNTPLQRIPGKEAGTVAVEGEGIALNIRSRFGEYLRVSTDTGHTGWIPDL